MATTFITAFESTELGRGSICRVSPLGSAMSTRLTRATAALRIIATRVSAPVARFRSRHSGIRATSVERGRSERNHSQVARLAREFHKGDPASAPARFQGWRRETVRCSAITYKTFWTRLRGYPSNGPRCAAAQVVVDDHRGHVHVDRGAGSGKGARLGTPRDQSHEPDVHARGRTRDSARRVRGPVLPEPPRMLPGLDLPVHRQGAEGSD